MSNNLCQADRINFRRNKLQEVACKLKKHFIGLDEVIDKLIFSITSWYCMPEILTRPTVINLFGMTGVGKTDLVRKLSQYLEMIDSFVEIQLANKVSTYRESSIQSLLSSSNISTQEPGILYLDEIQRFRTLNKQGEEIHDYNFQDVWTLLSDGNFGNNSTIKRDLLRMVYEEYYDQQFDNDDDDEEGSKKEKKFKHSFGHASRLKTMLRIDDSIEDVMAWSVQKKIDTILKKLDDKSVYNDEIYKKLLIIIAGNIDEAYEMANDTDQCNIDADFFHYKTKQINVLTIKDRLLRRFKPEQIARFGNCYILYPSLSKASYKELIRRKVVEVLHQVQKSSGVQISVEDSVYAAIYRNGVFPVSGTRPVFSTISSFFEGSLPYFVFETLCRGLNSLTLYYEDSWLKSSNGLELFIEGDVDKVVAAKNNIDLSTCSAVHESGHAILYAFLFKVAPTQVNIRLADNDGDGFVFAHDVHGSYTQHRNNIRVGLAGIAAERVIFGRENIASSSGGDHRRVTSIAAKMIRRWGMQDTKSFIMNPGGEDSDFCNTSIEASNVKIEEILVAESEFCDKILQENKALLIRTSQYLLGHSHILPQDFQKLCAEFGIKIDVVDPKATLYPAYFQMFEQAKKEVELASLKQAE